MSDTQIGALFLILGLVLLVYNTATLFDWKSPVGWAYNFKGYIVSILCIIAALFYFSGFPEEEQTKEQFSSPLEAKIDSIIIENTDACKAHLYTCLKYALAEELNKSKDELVLFKGCLGDLPVKGSYPICANHLGMIMEDENLFHLKMAVETLIPSLDSLQYDSLWLFQPSEPYTVDVSD